MKHKGFNLAEIIVALGILSGIFLVVAALFTQLLRGTKKEADLAAGALVAQKVMTQRLQSIYAGLDPVLTKDQFFSQDTPDLEGTVTLNKSVYRYRMTHSLIEDSSGDPFGGPAANENRLKKIDIIVWWGESEGAVRAGAGKQQIEATRLVNENSDFDS